MPDLKTQREQVKRRRALSLHTLRVYRHRRKLYRQSRKAYLNAKKQAVTPVSLGQRALAAALKDIGKDETGGNNRGRFVDLLNRESGSYVGAPWCGAAVFHWYKLAGSKAVSSAWVYVPTLRKSAGLVKTDNPLPGDIVTYEFTGDSTSDHTGLFERWTNRASGNFNAIEGNTKGSGAVSDGGGGEGVRRRDRNTNLVSGFYRVTR